MSSLGFHLHRDLTGTSNSKALLDQSPGSNSGNQARTAPDKGQLYNKNNAGGLAGGAVASGLPITFLVAKRP